MNTITKLLATSLLTLLYTQQTFALSSATTATAHDAFGDSNAKPEREAWAARFDNDILAPGGKDQDYTFGGSLTYAGSRLNNSWATGARNTIDNLLNIEEANNKRNRFEFGLYAFTPAQRDSSGNDNDRPYASLIYGSSTNERVDISTQSALQSQLTVGVLGLDLVGDIQNATHRLIGNTEEQGWSRQVSAGGEPTLRYSLAKQQLLGSHFDRFEWKSTQSISVGYITEASYALSLRAGHFQSVWYDFNPEMVNYAENQTKRNGGAHGCFFWAGIAVKARAYNAFLQGQFRHSEISFNSNELQHLIVEAWAGYTYTFNNGYFFSYGARAHTSEVKSGPADRSVVWGGISFGRQS